MSNSLQIKLHSYGKEQSFDEQLVKSSLKFNYKNRPCEIAFTRDTGDLMAKIIEAKILSALEELTNAMKGELNRWN